MQTTDRLLNGTFFKRVGAYVLDILIVSLVVYLLSFISFLNPNHNAYTEKYNELLNLQQQFTNNEISAKDYETAFKPIAYEIHRLETNYVIIDIVVVLLYFAVLQYFAKGQTIGKKLFQIRVVSNNKEPLTIVNFLLRSIVLNNILISVALQCVIHFMTSENYYNVYQNINLVGSIITYTIIFMVIVRRDGRGLHDYVANTKVVLDNTTTLERKRAKEEHILDLEAKEIKKDIKK